MKQNTDLYKLVGTGQGMNYQMTGNLLAVANKGLQLHDRLGMVVLVTRRPSGQVIGTKAMPLPLPGKVG